MTPSGPTASPASRKPSRPCERQPRTLTSSTGRSCAKRLMPGVFQKVPQKIPGTVDKRFQEPLVSFIKLIATAASTALLIGFGKALRADHSLFIQADDPFAVEPAVMEPGDVRRLLAIRAADDKRCRGASLVDGDDPEVDRAVV